MDLVLSALTEQKQDQNGRERGIDRVLKLFAYLNDYGRPVRVADLPKALSAPRSTIAPAMAMPDQRSRSG